jgi:hypothetical protein
MRTTRNHPAGGEPQKERWIPILGYEGIYEVSDQGRIRSLSRAVGNRSRSGNYFTYEMPGRVLRPCPGSHGYLMVYLCKCGRKKGVLLHRIVLEAFVGPCPDGCQAGHGAGGKLDNRLANLRWRTLHENNFTDKIRDGKDARGEKHGASKLTQGEVKAIRADCRSCSEIAKDYGIHPRYVSLIRRRKRWAWLP